jgi:tetratricopeptide (TPR) repeat protein
VTPRRRVQLVVALVALAVAAGTVGATLLYDDAGGGTRAREGAPPLLLDLLAPGGARERALRRAEALYDRGERKQAGAIFARYPRVLEAEIGSALVRWPRSSTRTLEALVREHPRRAVARLHVGLARYWERDLDGAREAWNEAERVEPDSPAALRAEDLLHPEFARGRPPFLPSFSRASDRRGKELLAGVRAQRLGRPVTARKAFAAAVRVAPNDPEALTAAAVVRFDKDDPAAAFSRLGPLSKRFPGAATVRFHLGLLLLWSGQVREGKRQLGLVKKGPLAVEAKRFLVRLASVK